MGTTLMPARSAASSCHGNRREIDAECFQSLLSGACLGKIDIRKRLFTLSLSSPAVA